MCIRDRNATGRFHHLTSYTHPDTAAEAIFLHPPAHTDSEEALLRLPGPAEDWIGCPAGVPGMEYATTPWTICTGRWVTTLQDGEALW
eukprot:8848665-Prorocentrum_lima.AAC.1